MDLQIGTVTHFYDTKNIAIVTVIRQSIRVGDLIYFSGPKTAFDQRVTDIYRENEKISQINMGESAVIKVSHAVYPGDMVYLRHAPRQ